MKNAARFKQATIRPIVQFHCVTLPVETEDLHQIVIFDNGSLLINEPSMLNWSKANIAVIYQNI